MYNIVWTNFVTLVIYVMFERPIAHCLEFLRVSITGDEYGKRNDKLNRSINETEDGDDVTPVQEVDDH